MATRNHAPLLQRTLRSIFAQRAPGVEVIVVDDSSTDDTAAVAQTFPVVYRRLELGPHHSHFAGTARNIGLRLAKGEIVIQQSDDVVHAQCDTIEQLISELHRGEFIIATVYDWTPQTGKMNWLMTGTETPRPLFFLGAHWRQDAAKVGGYDERFRDIYGYDDDWFADCLIHGAGLKCRFVPVLGLHQSHDRPSLSFQPGGRFYESLKRQAESGAIPYCAVDGSWLMKISVLCCTFLRPHLLPDIVDCFQSQDYTGPKELIILDDAGQYAPGQGGKDWQLVSIDRRFRTLGEKRMAAVALSSPDTEAYCMWDDDDLYLPHTLSAVSTALEQGDFAMPSKIFRETLPEKYEKRPGDGVFHPAWGFRRELFEEMGGYSARDIGEDDFLYHRILQSQARIVDPIALGYGPYFVWRTSKRAGYHTSRNSHTYADLGHSELYRNREKGIRLPLNSSREKAA